MELVFVDETSDDNFKDYFGLSIAIINHVHYKSIKNGFQDILQASSWDCSIEFKGAFLFSASKGDPKVDIDKRVSICEKIIELNTSDKNARMRFFYVSKRGVSDFKAEYLNLLPNLLKKALPKPAKEGSGKDICSVCCDFRSDIKPIEIYTVIQPVLNEKKYTLFENINMSTSGFQTVGILYADIVGYLAARIETISSDIELFENITPEMIRTNGKLKKLQSSDTIIKRIKRLEWYNVAKRNKNAKTK